MRTQHEVMSLVQAEGVVLRREHPRLGDALDRMLASGQLASVLPGVLVPKGSEQDPLVRIRALARWDRDAIFTGTAAAWLSYWPEVRVDRVEVASTRKHVPQPGFAFSRRHIADELIVHRNGLRLTSPSLTALDLSDLDHTDALDTALRTRAATIDTLHAVLRLSPGRRGNRDRLQVVLDSRDEPWSRAERMAHRLLHQAGIRGWKANLPIWVQGRLYYLDIAFGRARLAIEVDGRFHEDDRDQFESDRWRQNALVWQGWRVLRFTWRMLREEPDQFVQAVRQAL